MLNADVQWYLLGKLHSLFFAGHYFCPVKPPFIYNKARIKSMADVKFNYDEQAIMASARKKGSVSVP